MLFFSYSYSQTNDDYLNSKTVSLSKDAVVNDDNWPTVVSITIDTHCVAIGIMFDHLDMIKKFTVSYTLNGKNVVYKDHHFQEQATIYLFKFNNGIARTMSEICLKLTIKARE